MPKIHKAFDRVFLGFRAKAVDVTGSCREYTDTMPSKEQAKEFLQKNMAPWPDSMKIVIVKVFGPLIKKPELKNALEDVLDAHHRWEDLRDATGLSEERCKQIWVMAGRSL